MPAGAIETEPEMHLHPSGHEKSAGAQKDEGRLAELGYEQVSQEEGEGGAWPSGRRGR